MNKTYKRPSSGFKRPIRQQIPQKQSKPKPETFINFCKKKSVSMSNQLQDFVIDELTKKYYFEHKQVIPLESTDIPNPAYLVTINKKNKFSFLLFLTRFQNKNYSIFAYNHKGKLHLYSVKFGFNNDLYNGTLFKGELVKNDKECWIYYITDLLYYKGNYTYENKLSQKLKILAGLFKNEYVFDDFMNVCHLQIKGYILFNHLQFIKKDCQLLFVPEYYNDPIFSYNVVLPKKEENKIKNNDEKILIIKKTETFDVYELYDIKTNKFDSIACVNKLTTSTYLREEFKKHSEFKVRVKYSSYFQSWVPIH